MANAPEPKLICAQCGYDNEPERVYCHNCGTKLDRSVLPRDTATQQENLAATRKRIRKMTHPTSLMPTIKTFINTMIYSSVIAAIYLLAMPPANIPTRQMEADANIITADIDAAIEALQPVSIQATGPDVSQHVRSRVKGVSAVPLAQFKRTFASIEDGKVIFGVEQELFGLPLYSRVMYEPKVVDGNFKATPVGVYIGRLGFHPALGMDKMLSKIWTSLKREKQLILKAQSITVTKERVVIVTKPGPPPSQ